MSRSTAMVAAISLFGLFPPTDGKIGQLFVLGQCACGNDWQTKFNDLTIKGLSKWFNPLSIVEPVRCFSTPFHVTDAMLREASREGGIVFDRARLVRLSRLVAKDRIEPEIHSKMNRLIELVIGQCYQMSGRDSATA